MSERPPRITRIGAAGPPRPIRLGAIARTPLVCLAPEAQTPTLPPQGQPSDKAIMLLSSDEAILPASAALAAGGRLPIIRLSRAE